MTKPIRSKPWRECELIKFAGYMLTYEFDHRGSCFVHFPSGFKRRLIDIPGWCPEMWPAVWRNEHFQPVR